jgi:hypothetical protein
MYVCVCVCYMYLYINQQLYIHKPRSQQIGFWSRNTDKRMYNLLPSPSGSWRYFIAIYWPCIYIYIYYYIFMCPFQNGFKSCSSIFSADPVGYASAKTSSCDARGPRTRPLKRKLLLAWDQSDPLRCSVGSLWDFGHGMIGMIHHSCMAKKVTKCDGHLSLHWGFCWAS